MNVGRISDLLPASPRGNQVPSLECGDMLEIKSEKRHLKRKCEFRADAELLEDTPSHQSVTPKGILCLHPPSTNSCFSALRDSLNGSGASEKGSTGLQRDQEKGGDVHWQTLGDAWWGTPEPQQQLQSPGTVEQLQPSLKTPAPRHSQMCHGCRDFAGLRAQVSRQR